RQNFGRERSRSRIHVLFRDRDRRRVTTINPAHAAGVAATWLVLLALQPNARADPPADTDSAAAPEVAVPALAPPPAPPAALPPPLVAPPPAPPAPASPAPRKRY